METFYYTVAMTKEVVRILCLSLLIFSSLIAQEPEVRPQSLKATARINAVDRTFEEWKARTGEKTPDLRRAEHLMRIPRSWVAGKASARRVRTTRRWVRGFT